MATADAIAIIPARLGSSRFPAKVLANATGHPLIKHVCDAAAAASTIKRVIVATDHERVREAVTSFGGECLMTSSDHPNGTSRLAEACDLLDLPNDQVIVNVQGDEPELEPSIIDRAVEALVETGAETATAARPFASGVDPSDPNIVKVVRSLDAAALYFSRSLVPFPRDDTGPAQPLHHIGLYVYRRSFLRLYAALDPTPLEQTEKLEQLRVLEHGHSMAVALCNASTHAAPGIDTPEQYEAFVERWRRRHAAVDERA